MAAVIMVLKNIGSFLLKNPIAIFAILFALAMWDRSRLEGKLHDARYNSDEYREKMVKWQTEVKTLESEKRMLVRELVEAQQREAKFYDIFKETSSDEEFKNNNPVNFVDANTDWNTIKSATDSISNGSTRFP